MLAALTNLPEESLRAMRLLNPAPFVEFSELKDWAVKGNRFLSARNGKEVLELRVQAYAETALLALEKQHQSMRVAQQRVAGQQVEFGGVDDVLLAALQGIAVRQPRQMTAEERLRLAQWQILIYFLPCVVEPDCALRIARCVQVREAATLTDPVELRQLWLEVRQELFWNTDPALDRGAYLKELLEFARYEGEECLNFFIRLDALLLKGEQRFTIVQSDVVRERANGAAEVSMALLYAWPFIMEAERKALHGVFTLQAAILASRTEVSGVTHGKYSSQLRVFGDQYAPSKEPAVVSVRGGGGFHQGRSGYTPASGLFLPAADKTTFVAHAGGSGGRPVSGGVDGSGFKYREREETKSDRVKPSGKPTVAFGGSTSSAGGGETKSATAGPACPHCGNAHSADSCWKQFPGKAPCGLRMCVGKPAHSKSECTVVPWKRPDKPVTRSMGGSSPSRGGSYSTRIGELTNEDFGEDGVEQQEVKVAEGQVSKQGAKAGKDQVFGKAYGEYGSDDKYLFARVRLIMEDLSMEAERSTDPKRMFTEERYQLETVAALDTCSGPSLISFEMAAKCGSPIVGSMVLGTLNGETPPTPVVLAWVLSPTGKPVRLQFGIAAKAAMPSFRAGKGRAHLLIGMQDIAALGIDLNALVYGGGLSLKGEIPQAPALVEKPGKLMMSCSEVKAKLEGVVVSPSVRLASQVMLLASSEVENEEGIECSSEYSDSSAEALQLGAAAEATLKKFAELEVASGGLSGVTDRGVPWMESPTGTVLRQCLDMRDASVSDRGSGLGTWDVSLEPIPWCADRVVVTALPGPYDADASKVSVCLLTTSVGAELEVEDLDDLPSSMAKQLVLGDIIGVGLEVEDLDDLPNLVPVSDDDDDGDEEAPEGARSYFTTVERSRVMGCYSIAAERVKMEGVGSPDEDDLGSGDAVEELRETLYEELGYYPSGDFGTAVSWEDPKVYFQANPDELSPLTIEVALQRMQPFRSGTDGTEEELAHNWLSLNLKLGLRSASKVLQEVGPLRSDENGHVYHNAGELRSPGVNMYTVPGPGSKGWCYALAATPERHENALSAFSSDELFDPRSATPEMCCTLELDGSVKLTGCQPELESCYLGEAKVRLLLERRLVYLGEHGNPAKATMHDRIMKGVAKDRLLSLEGRLEGKKVMLRVEAMVQLFVARGYFSDQPGLATHVPPVSIRLKAGAAEGLRSHKCPVFGPATTKVLKDYVEACVSAGTHKLVPPSQAAYAWRPVISCKDVNAECPKLRVCNDVTSVNLWEEEGQTPVPFPSWIRTLSAGHHHICTMDISAGFNNLAYTPESGALYGLWTPSGVLVPLRMIFGGTSNSSRFQEAMEKALSEVPELGTSVFVYIDDVIVFSKTIYDHIDLVQRVVESLGEVGFRLAPDKFRFGCAEATVLGFLVGEEGISPAPHNLSKMLGLKTPLNDEEVAARMGLLQYYKSSVETDVWLSTTRVIRNLSKKPVCERQTAFDQLLQAIHSAPPLAAFDPKAQLSIDCDASNLGAGGCLSVCTWKSDAEGIKSSEVSGGVSVSGGAVSGGVSVSSRFDEEGRLRPDKEQPLEWYAKPWTEAQSRWPIYVREAFALVYCLEQAALYTESSIHPVIVRTDHRPLLWLRHATSPMVVRWVAQFLQNLNFKIEYRPGPRHANADFASRDLVLLESSAPGQPTRCGRMVALEALVDHWCCPTLTVDQRFLLSMDGVEAEASAFLRSRGKCFSTPLVASPTAKVLEAGWSFGVFTPPAERAILWAAILFAQSVSFAILVPSDLVHLIPLPDPVSVSRFRGCVRIAFLDSNLVWLVVGLESKVANQVLWTESSWEMDIYESLSFAEVLQCEEGPLSSEPQFGEHRKSRRKYSGYLHETEEEMGDALGSGVFLIAAHGRKSRLGFSRADVAEWYKATEDPFSVRPLTEAEHQRREWLVEIYRWVERLHGGDEEVYVRGSGAATWVASVLDSGDHLKELPVSIVESGDFMVDVDGVAVTKEGVVFLPPPFQRSALGWCHKWSNHGGVRNALKLLHTRFIWPSSGADVERYVRECVFCALANARHSQIQTYSSIVPDRPCQVIGADWYGPFTPDEEGNRYVLGQIDFFYEFVNFSCDVEATALRGVRHIADHTLYVRGVPEAILSDNHSVFRAQLVAGVCQEVGIKQLFTAPYSQFQNGKVERRMAFLTKFLQSLDSDDLRHWGQLMPLLSSMVNSIPNAITGVSPAQLERPWMQAGNQITTDHALLARRLQMEVPEEERAQQVSLFLQKVSRVSELFHRLVREERQPEYDRVLQQLNAKNAKSAVVFKVGDRVAMARPARKANMSKKLLLQWRGSYEVVAEVAHNKFKLRHEEDESVVFASPRNLVHYTPSLADTIAFYAARRERDVLAIADDATEEDFQFGEQMLPGSIIAMGDDSDEPREGSGSKGKYWLGRVLDLNLADAEVSVQYYVTTRAERNPVFLLAWVDQVDGAIIQRAKAPASKVVEPWLGIVSLASVFAIKLSFNEETNKLSEESASALRGYRPAVMKVKRG